MELPEADQPPEEIWLDQESIVAHFEMVRERYRSNSGGDSSSDWGDDGWEQNELTRHLKTGR